MDENIYKELFSNSNDGIILCDSEGKIVSVSNALGPLFGVSSNIFLGEKYSVLDNYMNNQSLKKCFKDMVKGKEANKYAVFKSVQGDLIDLNVNFKKIDDKSSKGYLITIKKGGSDLLNHKLINEHTSDIISMAKFSLNPVFTYCSPSHLSLLGIDPKELIGTSSLNMIHPEDKKKLFPLLKKYVRNKMNILSSGKADEMMFSSLSAMIIETAELSKMVRNFCSDTLRSSSIFFLSDISFETNNS